MIKESEYPGRQQNPRDQRSDLGSSGQSCGGLRAELGPGCDPSSALMSEKGKFGPKWEVVCPVSLRASSAKPEWGPKACTLPL